MVLVWLTVVSTIIAFFCSFCIAFWYFYFTLFLPFLLSSLSAIICKSIFLHQQKIGMFFWLCLCFSMIAFIIVTLFIVDLFSFLQSSYWTCCFVLPHSRSLQFHVLWTLCFKNPSPAFLNFFLLIHLLCIVTLLMSLSPF